MNPELDFEAMPFETFDGFPTPASERSDVEAEGEFGRRSSWRRSRPSPMPRARFQQPGAKFQRSKKPATLGPRRPKKPPSRPSRFPRVRGRWPLGVIQEPYRVVTEPDSIEPTPSGSKYMRWVQSALNVVLGLRLPIDGIADSATRSAIRSFQKREGLPVDGVVGPETERALIAARRGESSRRRRTKRVQHGGAIRTGGCGLGARRSRTHGAGAGAGAGIRLRMGELRGRVRRPAKER